MSSKQYPQPAQGAPPAYDQFNQYPQSQGYGSQQYGPGQPYGGQPYEGQAYSGPQQYGTGVPPPQPNVGFAYGNPDQPPPSNTSQGYGQPKPDYPHTDDMFDDNSFSNKTVRRGFIRKVYLILFTQLFVTFGFVMLFSNVDKIGNFVRTGSGVAVYYVSYGTFLVTYFVLICIPSVRRKHPGNLICLAVFTLAFTYMVSMISTFYTTKSVMVAAGITTLVCLGITLFAIQTKIDFTMCAGLLFVLVLVLLFFGFSVLIVTYTVGRNYILDCVYGGLAALVFSLFLIYDTQMIVGGRKHEMSPEEYVYGALQLYIDVVYLFLIILSLFGKSN